MFKYIKISATSTILLLLSLSALAHYPYVQIQNKTDRAVAGTVHYNGESEDDCTTGGWCTCDQYNIAPHKTWEASSRGACLVDNIQVNWSGATPNSGIPYSNNELGTRHGKFSVVRNSNGRPQVVWR